MEEVVDNVGEWSDSLSAHFTLTKRQEAVWTVWEAKRCITDPVGNRTGRSAREQSLY
jgi:hypothetical protein